MPESMNKSLSAESFEALLDALGLSDEDSTTVTVKPIPSYIPSDMISPPRPITPFSTVDYSIADEARYSLYGQDYLSDFDIWADIEDEDSDGDFEDALPSRPGSSFESFEVISDPAYSLAHPGPFPLSPNPDLSPLYQTTFPPASLTLQCNTILSPPPSKRPPATPSVISMSSSTPVSTVSPTATRASAPSSMPTSPASCSSCCGDDHSDAIQIKAALNASIIMLRVPRAITFAELKLRLYDKFVGQESIHLSHAFSVVNVLPPASSTSTSTSTSPSSSAQSSPRTSPIDGSPPTSVSLSGRTTPGLNVKRPLWLERSPVRRPRGISFAERTEMRFIDREADWRKIVALDCEDGNKIALRILDTPP